MIFARKINKILKFYMIFVRSARILHNNCRKNIFSDFFFGGEGGHMPLPPSHTPMFVLKNINCCRCLRHVSWSKTTAGSHLTRRQWVLLLYSSTSTRPSLVYNSTNLNTVCACVFLKLPTKWTQCHQALPTLLLCFFLGSLSDFQSTKALSFFNRSL